MVRRLVLLAAMGAMAAGLLTMTLGAVRPAPAVALTNCDTSTADLDASELQLLELVNAARTAKGFAPVKVSPALSRAAAWKSEDSSATFQKLSHTDSSNRSPYQRAIDCGYAGNGGNENIGAPFSTAQSIFQAFMSSPYGHACPIDGTQVPGAPACNPGTPGYFKVVGIGFNPSYGAWTLMFGTYDDSGDTGVPGSGGGSGSGGPATPTPFPPTSTPAPMPTPTPPPMRPRVSIPMLASE